MSNNINIIVIVDTDRIIRDYGDNISKDPEMPTQVGYDYQYLIVSNNKELCGEGTGHLYFSAEIGDLIRVHGMSVMANFKHPVLIYNVQHKCGDKVFGQYEYKAYEDKTIVPGSKGSLPVKFAKKRFWFYEAQVVRKGVDIFTYCYAMYIDEKLYGYFSWDPIIRVTD